MLFLVALASFAQTEEVSHVVVLTKENFSEVISTNALVLVEFYAPWCGHCKILAPEYEKAAASLKQKVPELVLAKVDATEQTELATAHDINGYPTLKVFRNGVSYDYEGPRDSDGIVGYMLQQASPDYQPPADAVITLTEADFADVVLNAPLILVEFYAPWCGHCKRLEPDYKKAAVILKANDPSIPLAKVNAEENSALAQQYGVTGYPTLIVFRNGRRSDFTGERNVDGIVSFMKSRLLPSFEVVKNDVVLKRLIAWDGIPVVVAFFEEHDSSELLASFKLISSDLSQRAKFVVVPSAKVASQFDQKLGTVVLFYARNYVSSSEPSFVRVPEDVTTTDQLVSFFDNHEITSVHQLTKENTKSLKKPLLITFLDVDWSESQREETLYWRNQLLKVAKKHSAIQFAIADSADFLDRMKEFNLDGREKACAIIDKHGAKYRMDKQFSLKALEEFVSAFEKGSLPVFLKSAKTPKNVKGPVKEVVGKTFAQHVTQSDANVLIEFYAPWCGHCKQLEPKYTELGNLFADSKEVSIARMDATENDAPPNFEVSGFPTIFLVRKSDKQHPIKYEGEREVEAMAAWIRSQIEQPVPSKEEL